MPRVDTTGYVRSATRLSLTSLRPVRLNFAERRQQMKNKLRWSDLLNIWLWHAYGNDQLVQDDTAYVALLRTKRWVDEALGILESPAGSEPTEE